MRAIRNETRKKWKSREGVKREDGEIGAASLVSKAVNFAIKGFAQLRWIAGELTSEHFQRTVRASLEKENALTLSRYFCGE
jgi:hypothetical protein